MPPNHCEVPTPAKRTEAEIYRSIRDRLIRVHCAADRAHRCCGAITITRDAITMSCPLCGDARQILSDNTTPTPTRPSASGRDDGECHG